MKRNLLIAAGVIAALLLLVVFVLPRIGNDDLANMKRTGAGIVGCMTAMKTIGAALEMYKVDHGGKYPDHLLDLTPRYLTTIPTCPESGSSESYERSYASSGAGKDYQFQCYQPSHYRYTSAEGVVR